MLEIRGLKKSFGKQHALRGIDLSLTKGNITAILGPNASGKTTLIKSVLGLVIPDAGEILIDGETIARKDAYRNKISYLPQIAQFPENLRGMELVKMLKSIRVTGPGENELIEALQLCNSLQQPLRTLSGGTKQKINVLLALMFDAPLLILDEPTNGLDPRALISLKEILATEKQRGKTIVLTTHSMGLVEELADEIVFLLEGRVHFHGSVTQLCSEQNESRVEYAIAKLTENIHHPAP